MPLHSLPTHGAHLTTCSHVAKTESHIAYQDSLTPRADCSTGWASDASHCNFSALFSASRESASPNKPLVLLAGTRQALCPSHRRQQPSALCAHATILPPLFEATFRFRQSALPCLERALPRYHCNFQSRAWSCRNSATTALAQNSFRGPAFQAFAMTGHVVGNESSTSPCHSYRRASFGCTRRRGGRARCGERR